MSSERKFWDRHAKVYDLFMSKDKKTYENIYNQMKNKLNNEMNVLEVCTGTGIIAESIYKDTKCLTAIDYSKNMIDIAKKKNKGNSVNYLVEDAYDLSFEDDSFDAVIITNSLHILEDPDMVLSEIKRVLKRDGILIAPNFTHKNQLNKLLILGKLIGFRAKHAWDREGYVDFIEENGFVVTKSIKYKSSYPITYLEADAI